MQVSHQNLLKHAKHKERVRGSDDFSNKKCKKTFSIKKFVNLGHLNIVRTNMVCTRCGVCGLLKVVSEELLVLKNICNQCTGIYPFGKIIGVSQDDSL